MFEIKTEESWFLISYIMLLKHVYMGYKFQRIFKLSISFSLKHFFISVAISTQAASAPLMETESRSLNSTSIFVFLGSKASAIFSSIYWNFLFLLFLLFSERINRLKLFIYLIFKISLSCIIFRIIFVQGKCFCLKNLNNFLSHVYWWEKFLNVSSLKIVVNILM